MVQTPEAAAGPPPSTPGRKQRGRPATQGGRVGTIRTSPEDGTSPPDAKDALLAKEEPLLLPDVGQNSDEEEERFSLQRRVFKSDELIKQLKHIVKAQHGKIEELRERLEAAPLNVRTMIADQNRNNMEALKAESEEWRKKVQISKGELARAKKEIETLRKANRRLRAMLDHQGLEEPPYRSVAPAFAEGDSLFMSFPPSRGDVGASLGVSRGSVSFADADHSSVSSIFPDTVLEERENEQPRALVTAGSMEPRPSTAAMATSQQDEGRSSLLRSLTMPSHMEGRPSLAGEKLEGRPSTVGEKGHGAMPTASRLSRLSAALPMLWREQESPSAVLRALTDIGSRVLGVTPKQALLTVYLLDPWLRSAADSEQQEVQKEFKPTVFHLGQGAARLQVLTGAGITTRAEPPSFPDLQSLPYCTKTTLAIAVQLKDRQFAVLQATATASSSSTAERGAEGGRPSAATSAAMASTRLSTLGNWPSTDDSSKRVSTPRVLLNSARGKSFDNADQETNLFSESQLGYLQLACTAAAGTLAEIERIKQRQRGVDRMRTCMEVAVEVNKARSLPDFEQRAKHLLSTFFNVNTVRLFFYDPGTNTLLNSSAQLRKKEPTSFKLDTGIVGLCARRQQVMHIPNISQHPYIDAAVDGLHRTGRPVGAHASMLVGPLIIDAADNVGLESGQGGGGPLLLGVAQLLERKKKPSSGVVKEGQGGAAEGEFTVEEQDLFKQLLRVCTYSAWRTLKVQEYMLKAEGSPHTLQRMLAGT